MTSERMTVDMSLDERAEIIQMYIRKHFTEATNDLINEEFGEINVGNCDEAAGTAIMNEMVIKILEEQIEYEKNKEVL